MDLKNILNRAENVETPPQILTEIFDNYQEKEIRYALVNNPNTPLEILMKLGKDFPAELINNPILDLCFIENPQLIIDIPIDTLYAVFRLENLPQYVVFLALNYLADGNNDSQFYRVYEAEKIEMFGGIISEYIKLWNQWRENNNNKKICLDTVDWRSTNLENANLSNMSLRAANFHNANLTNVNFENSDFSYIYQECGGETVPTIDSSIFDTEHCIFPTWFVNANLTNTNFKNADLEQANLKGTNLTNTDFTNANLSYINFRDVEILPSTKIDKKWLLVKSLIHSESDNIFFKETDFSYGFFEDIDLSNADLKNCNFRGAYFNEVNFKNANLEGVDFSASYFFNDTNFEGANLKDTNFTKIKTDFWYGTLSNLNLK